MHPVPAGDWLAKKQLCNKGLAGHPEQQVTSEPVIWPCSKRGKQYLCCISKCSSWREVIFKHYSRLVRHPDIQSVLSKFGFPGTNDMDLLEQVQPKVTTILEGLEHLTHEVKLRQLGLFNLEMRNLGVSYNGI